MSLEGWEIPFPQAFEIFVILCNYDCTPVTIRVCQMTWSLPHA